MCRQNQEEDTEVTDIPPVSVNTVKKTISLGGVEYDLIMCYLCPICNIPVYAQWKLDGKKAASDNTIGRALRDSGFSSYRIFASEGGQGFEYDFDKDPRKKHSHEERPTHYGDSYGRATHSFRPFLALNPLINVNEFLNYALNNGETRIVDKVIETEEGALSIIKTMMELDQFKVLKDINNHGKPLFYLDTVPWNDEFRYIYGSRRGEAINVLAEWFDIQIVEPDKNPTLRIPVESQEGMEHLYQAQSHLRKAGVTFDTGYDMETKERDWHLDWSLKGATLNPRWLHPSKVQSVIFKKRFWTIPKAKLWLKKHGFKTPKVDTTETEYRFRQFHPRKAVKGHFGSIPFTRSIRALVAEPKPNPTNKNPQPVVFADTPIHYTEPEAQLLISQIKGIPGSSPRNIFTRAHLIRKLQELTGMWSLNLSEVITGHYDIRPIANPGPNNSGSVNEYPLGDRGPTFIIGGPGSGKSATGWDLVEKEHKKNPKKKVAAVKFPRASRKLLPKWVTVFVDTIEEVPTDSIACVDEAEDVASKWDHKRDSHLARTLRLARQNRITLFYINQDTYIDKGAAMKVRNLIIKEVGVFQAGLERSGVGKYIRAATEALQLLPVDDVVKYGYIITPRGQGLIPTSTPSFWSEGLSEAYAEGPCEIECSPEEMVTVANPEINGIMHSIVYGCPGPDCDYGLCQGQIPPVTPYEHVWEQHNPTIRSEGGNINIVGEVIVKNVGRKSGINDAPEILDSPSESDNKARHAPMFLYTIGNLVQIKLKDGCILPLEDKYLVTGKDAKYLFVVEPDIARMNYLSPEDFSIEVKNGRHIVMFGSSWCPHSQKMRKRLAGLSKSYPDIKVSIVDADAAPKLSKSLGLQDTPTTLFYNEGALVGFEKGNKPIDEKISEIFYFSTAKGEIAAMAAN